MKRVLLSCLVWSLSFAAAASSDQPAVLLVPNWASNHRDTTGRGPEVSTGPTSIASDKSCLNGQWHYRYSGPNSNGANLLQRAMSDQPPSTKGTYLAIATWLGYFTDDSVVKDEIITKVKPIIDKDYRDLRNILASRPYFLIVGDTSFYQRPDGGYESRTGMSFAKKTFDLPYFAGYDWDTDSFHMNAFGFQSNSMPVTFKVTSKEWKENYAGILDTNEGNKKLGSRLLLNSNLEPVLAEIFLLDSGKTIVKWAAKGQDVEKLSSLVPDQAVSEYDFSKIDGCNSLNTEYFSDSISNNNENPIKKILLPKGLPKLW